MLVIEPKSVKEPELKYSAEEVLAASLTYFEGDDLAASTFANKYALRKAVGDKFLFAERTPDDMHDRLAREFARVDAKYSNPRPFEVFRVALNHFRRIVPQGSPMFGVGNSYVHVSLSNCVVVASPDDNISSIIDTGKDLANLFKRRCGVGLDISSLRPEGSPVNNSALTTTGAWSFSDFYSYVCRMIGQNGRRGALMITMDVRHPDIVQFTLMKRDLAKVTGANVSIRLTDEFMHAVEKDEDWECRWPIESQASIKRVVRARDLWRMINESAVKSAEPGLLFWDNYLNNLPAESYSQFKTISTNPCSEIGLSAYDSCRLISINLNGYVKNAFESNALLDFKGLDDDIRLGMRMIDDLVDLEVEHLSDIIESVDEQDEKLLWSKLRKSAIDGRRTGLGTHGLADCLASLNLRYDSDAALQMVEKIYETLRNSAYDESVNLAIERGPFPVFDWNLEKENAFIRRLPKTIQEKIAKHGRRNISLLTMAPTGSVSILSQTSSGVEPVFNHIYTRRKKINPSDPDASSDFIDQMGDKWSEFAVFHHNLADFLKKERPQVWSRLQKGKEKIEDIEHVVLPSFFVTANSIDPKRRVEIQGIIQKYIDHGISSTINLPRDTTVEQGEELYMLAWKHGLKGVTVYVEGSRSGVLVNKDNRQASISETHAPKRQQTLPCEIHRVRVGDEDWTFLVGLLNGQPYEIFGGLAEKIKLPKKFKAGSIVRKKNGHGVNVYDLYVGDDGDPLVVDNIVETFANPNFGVMTRLLSAHLRHGVPIQFIVQQLARDPSSDFTSFARVVGRVLKKYITDGVQGGENCSECGVKLVFEQGCFLCRNCGFTKCD